MKKILFSMILAVAAMNINAQLVVDSLGRVGVGTEAPKSMLSIGTAGDSITAIKCNASNKQYGMYITNLSSETNAVHGGLFYAKNTLGSCTGLRGQATGNNDMEMSQHVIGISGRAGRAHSAVGVFGGRESGSVTFVDFAGVYGSQTASTPSFSNYPGQYAGFFKGVVRVTNGIYATVLSPVTSPSSPGQSGTSILSDRSECVTDKLKQVQAVQFFRYDPTTKESITAKASIPSAEEKDDMSPEELDSFAETTEEEPEPYLSPIQYGLDATQLKAVYPELVYEDANGNVSINYVEMVPLLVQSINELSAKVAELEGASPKKAKAEPTAIEGTVSDVDMVRMDQNNPNPFSESTVIALNIPEQTQTAKIFIYDMSGKQVQSIAVSERGETNITVYASDLTAGMYIYTLIVDGKVAVTRRMIVSNS